MQSGADSIYGVPHRETDVAGRMTNDLRRLRLRGLIERIPFTRRYRVTDEGLRTAICYPRTHARVLRPGRCLPPSNRRRAEPPGSTEPSTRSTGKYSDFGRATASPPDCNLIFNIGRA